MATTIPVSIETLIACHVVLDDLDCHLAAALAKELDTYIRSGHEDQTPTADMLEVRRGLMIDLLDYTGKLTRGVGISEYRILLEIDPRRI